MKTGKHGGKMARMNSLTLTKNKKAEQAAEYVEGFGEELGLRGGKETPDAGVTETPGSTEHGSGEATDVATNADKRKERKTMRHHTGILSLDDFRQWRYSCGVFKVQKEYEIMVQEAHANGRSIEAEMKAQGFKDYNTFARSCERFNLSCCSAELAELGSGFVLYFNLITFLASLLVVVGLMQVPAIAYHSSYNAIEQWWWHDWTTGWSDSRSCECLGDNRGVHGPSSAFQNASYGTSCAAWDQAWCFDNNGPFANTGKWCCRPWCFVSSSCLATLDETSPSRSDRHYRGMVRSMTACQQNEVQVATQCSALEETAFAEAGVEKIPDGYYIAGVWATPGNLGPAGGDESFILIVYVILTQVFHFLIAITRHHQSITEDVVDSESTTPNDFAVMVKGLPATCIDERTIQDFFRQHAVRGKADTEIVKVIIGYDAKDFRDMQKEIESLRKKLEDIDDKDSFQAREVQGRIKAFQDESSGSVAASSLKSSGAVVVVLRHQHDLRDLLHRWTSAWATRFYADADDIEWLPKNNGLKRGPPLPRFETDGVSCRIEVERAPNPGDINWLRLGVKKWDRVQKVLVTTLAMMVVVSLSFLTTWGLNTLQQHVKDESLKHDGGVSGYGFRLLSVLPGLCISLINVLIRVAARYFGEEEFHDTHTDKEFSQAMKMTIGMIINTSGSILFLNASPKSWYEKGGLIEDISYVLVMDAIVSQFWMPLDIIYIGNYFERAKVTPEKLADWNIKIAANYPPKSEEDKEALQAIRVEIMKCKQAFEPDSCDNPHRYSCALNSFICCIFYTPVCPLLPLVGLMGFFCQYWVDKLLLLRWQKRPRPQNGNMARWSLKFLKIVAPTTVAVSVFVFLTPSWKNKSYCLTLFCVNMAISFVMMLVPMSFWRGCFCQSCRASTWDIQDDDYEDYYHAQHMWPKEMKYHKDQFLYRNLPDDKNPEILEPEQNYTLDIADMQGNMAAAVEYVVTQTAYGYSNYSNSYYSGGGYPGYGDRGWGGGWLHATNYGNYGPQQQYPAYYGAPAAPMYPTYGNPYQPAAIGYGQPAGPGMFAARPPMAPASPANAYGAPGLASPANPYGPPGKGGGKGGPWHPGGWQAQSAPASGARKSMKSHKPWGARKSMKSNKACSAPQPEHWGSHAAVQSQSSAPPYGSYASPAYATASPTPGVWGPASSGGQPGYQWPARVQV